MIKQDLKSIVEKRLEDADYWSGKNGYEQEAIRELLVIVSLLTKAVFDEAT